MSLLSYFSLISGFMQEKQNKTKQNKTKQKTEVLGQERNIRFASVLSTLDVHGIRLRIMLGSTLVPLHNLYVFANLCTHNH